MTAPPLQYQCSHEQQCAKPEEKQEEDCDVLLPFAERSVERGERDEERPHFPHRVFDSLPCTLHLCLISHGPGEVVGEGRSVRAARCEPPNGSRLSCGRPARWRK